MVKCRKEGYRLNIAICDDDEILSDTIENYSLKYGEEFGFDIKVTKFNNGECLVDCIKTGAKFELIFLDIELGTTTGVEVGKMIREDFQNHYSKIVFISAADGYEMSLFKIQPMDFLRKPIKSEDIYSCIELTIKILNITGNLYEFVMDKKTIFINMSDILYFENSLRKIKLVTSEKEYIFYGKISTVLNDLPNTFLVPHNSFIVNYDNINIIGDEFITMKNGKEIPISRSHKKDVQMAQYNILRSRNNANF